MTRSTSIALLVLVALVHFATGEFCEFRATQTADIAAFWPPAGIGLAALILLGWRSLIAIAISALVSNVIDIGGNSAITVVDLTTIAIFNAGVDVLLAVIEPLVGVALLRQAGALPTPFLRVRTAATFLLISFLTAATIALSGALSLTLTNQVPWNGFGALWLTWTTGDYIGIIVVVPLVIAWTRDDGVVLTARWCAELCIVLVAVVLIAVPVAFDYPVEYLVLLPLVWAAFELGLRGASVTVLLVAIVAVMVDVEMNDGYFTRFHPTVSMLLIQSFVGSVAILPLVLIPALEERRVASATSAKLESDLELARSIQRGLLPDTSPSLHGFEITGWSRPADATGGDYFDWTVLPDGRVLVTLGDVSGHGVGPALVTAACRAYIRSLSGHNLALTDLLTRVNAHLFSDLPSNRFITLAALLITPGENRVEILSAGHAPICVYRHASQQVDVLDADDIPLGILDERAYDSARTIDLQTGDMIVIVTDGFTEWSDPEGEMFTVQRLNESIIAAAEHPTDEIIQALDADVRRHARGTPQDDDLTAVIIRRT
ncbi:MAG: SpoIIE family protein phosphatase [Planctomycetota bacterium]